MTNAAKDDRVLLELAAKAAGVKGHFIESFPEDGAPTYSCGIGNAGRITPLWNPLANDGDALRLAVKLDLEVIPSGAWVGASNNELAALVQNGCGIDAVEEHAGDPYAATRRAIVSVAAEIGKVMPA